MDDAEACWEGPKGADDRTLMWECGGAQTLYQPRERTEGGGETRGTLMWMRGVARRRSIVEGAARVDERRIDVVVRMGAEA